MPQPQPKPSLDVLENRISTERFAPYRVACANDPERAIVLNERNLALSAAFWEVLSDLEILVRNAMHVWFPCPELHDQALTTAGWVCPVTRDWIAARSRVPRLLPDVVIPGP